MLSIAKDRLLTLVKSRLALRSPGCLFGCLSPCQKLPNTQENGCLLPSSDHIQGETLFQARLDEEREIIGPASLLHIVDNGSYIWLTLLHAMRIKVSSAVAYDFNRQLINAVFTPPRRFHFVFQNSVFPEKILPF